MIKSGDLVIGLPVADNIYSITTTGSISRVLQVYNNQIITIKLLYYVQGYLARSLIGGTYSVSAVAFRKITEEELLLLSLRNPKLSLNLIHLWKNSK